MPLLAGRYAVIGAGHGGQAVAAYLAHRGFRVSLFNKSFERIRPILRENGVHLAGVVQDFARLDLVTTDIGQAVAGARVVMVVVPASAHRAIAYRLAPHLRDGQIVVLHPGRTGGAFEFRHALERAGSRAAVTIVEAQTFLFASRITGPARVTIHGVKQRVPVAALPASDTPAAVAILERAFPQFVPATSVLETSFDNIGAIFHPGPTLLNA
ncbi:MAG TPA: NAD(P)-binding domain-containing protein, partial [Bacillota bacterium]